MHGVVDCIHVSPGEGAPMHAVDRAEVARDLGLLADRYAREAAGAGRMVPAEQQVTLIEVESIEAVKEELRVHFTAAMSRRNVATRGCRLNALVGRTFRIGGDVVLRGVQLCHPCAGLERGTGIPGLTRTLAARGGLRAAVVHPGWIRPGDAIVPCDVPSPGGPSATP